MMERQAEDGTFYKQVGKDEWTPVTREAEDGTVYKKVGADDWAPVQTQQKPNEETKGFGQKVLENVVEPVATAIDYTYAPIRQAVAAPAKLAQGNISGALLDPFTQLAKSPKTAPTSAQVAEMYGVPEKKKVSPIVAANPMFAASSYEQNPMEDDPENVTIYPSQQAGALMDVALGGEGINLATKALAKGAGAIGKGASAVADYVSPPKPKLNAQQIKDAANRLGIKVTPAMLDDSEFLERLEYTLAESPSILGQRVKKAQTGVTDKLNSKVGDLTQDATNMTPYQVGEKFKSGVTAKVGERLDPISSVFSEVAENTKYMGIPQRSRDAVIRNIENMDTYKLTGGEGLPQKYVGMLSRIENADQVKTLMSMLRQDIRAASGSEKQVLSGIREKLQSLEKNTITRSAIQTAKEGGMRKSTGQNIGNEIINDLRQARTGYRELSEDLQGVAENARIRTEKGPSAFLDSVEQIPSERIQDKFFNVENNRQLQTLKEKFPEQFGLLREGKLKEIADASADFSRQGKGENSSARFLKEVRKLTPETKSLLFGENAAVIDDLQTVQNALPRNFNPSGSANQAGWQDIIYRNVTDVPKFMLYKGASSNLAKKASEKLARVPETLRISPQAESKAQLLSKPAAVLNTAKDESRRLVADQPQKGPDKWAIDGASKLKKHDSRTISDEVVTQLLKTKKGKDLLIRASDLKPGTKAMDQILLQIKSSYLQGGE